MKNPGKASTVYKVISERGWRMCLERREISPGARVDGARPPDPVMQESPGLERKGKRYDR